jgi:hypothetical protein
LASINLARIVRQSGAQIVQSKLPDPPKTRAPLPGEGGEAFIAWGEQADMSVASTTQTGTLSALPANDVQADGFLTGNVAPAPGALGAAVGITRPLRFRARPPVPQDRQPGIIAYDMIDGQWETIKVYSPDDKDVWVKVQRLKSCRFRASNGNIIKLNLQTLPAPRPPEG